MDSKRIVTSLDLILQWVVRLAVLNLLWIVFSFLGLLAGGVFPATAAALGVSRKWIKGDSELKIWKIFKQLYRKEFVSSNIVGWLLAVFGGLLYLNYHIIAGSAGEISIIIPFVFYFVLFFYCLIAIWSFPLLAHYKASWFQHIRNALIIGLTKIHYTLANFLVIFAVTYFSLSYPGLIPFFSISITAVGCMWFSMQIFEKLDHRSS
jgi:uncharacterized membrane protein YesL